MLLPKQFHILGSDVIMLYFNIIMFVDSFLFPVQ